jgi:salicylate hydroxylase
MRASDLSNLDVAVIGAGYAGAAAGKALSLLGCKVQVYEQAGEIREVGAGIGLRPSTMDRFRQWGILDAITRVSSPSDYFQILTATGDHIIQESWPEIDTYALTTHLIHRGDFIDALLGVLPRDMVQLGHAAAAIDDHGDTATVTFVNGARVTADLIIGADGIRSVVRKQLFSDQDPVFAGEHAYRTVIPVDDCYGMVSDDNLRMYLGHGTKVYLLPLRHRNQASFDITCLRADSAWAPVVSKDDILVAVAGFDERIINMTRDLDMRAVNVRAVYDIDPIDTWHSGCVVLVGDAAHAMLHHQGQGANSAILDVGALADALRDADSVKEALAAYQTARKPVTDELQRISRQGWSEDEVNDVFPGQKPATMDAKA